MILLEKNLAIGGDNQDGVLRRDLGQEGRGLPSGYQGRLAQPQDPNQQSKVQCEGNALQGV
jgi:hypothetical protein